MRLCGEFWELLPLDSVGGWIAVFRTREEQDKLRLVTNDIV